MELDMENVETETVIETENSEETKTRAPRTTTYYGFDAEEHLVTFVGTRDQAKDWSEGNLLTFGTTTLAFFRQRQNWWVLLTGEGGGEHQVVGTVPEAVEAAFTANGGKSKKPGKKRSKFKFKAATKLERHVVRWAKEKAEASEGTVADVLSHLVSNGAENYVEHLADSAAKLKFYKKYRIEISMLITDAIRSGLIETAADLEGWDSSDPLAQHEKNQNILAWFGFEMASRNLTVRAGMVEA